MRILLVSHSRDLYGASRSLLRTARRLHADGHGVRVLVPGDGPLREALAGAGVAAEIFPDLSIVDRAAFRSVAGLRRLLGGFPRAVGRLAAELRRDRPSLVHTNSSVVFSPGPAARRARVPHVWHVRECYDDFPRFWRVYRRALLRWADLVPCISEAVAGQFPPASRGKVRVIHNGIPRAEFEGVTAERVRAARARFGDPAGPVVLLPGRIKLVRKGQETFVRAAALLRDRRPAARFVIVGAPFPGNEGHLEALRRLAAEAGVADRVVFAGELRDMPAAYAASDLAVLASGTPEPLGGVVLEAMAMGLPVVATNIGGPPEMVADGETGFLVPPNDPAALAAAFDRLLADPALARRMGAAGRARFLERFEFEAFYRLLLTLYREIALSSGASADADAGRP